MKRALPFFVLATVIVLLLVGLSESRPRQYDERLRVERDGDEPFDAEALYRLLPDLLGAPVEPVGVTPYERLRDSAITETAYVFVTGAFEPDREDAEQLLDFMRRGNTLVVAAQAVGGPLFEALGDTTARDDDGYGLETNWSTLDFGDVFAEANNAFGPDVPADTFVAGRRRYSVPVYTGNAFLIGLDSARTAVIARREEGPTVAAAVSVGRGRAVVLAAPLALTNAALAGEGDAIAFAEALAGYVPPVRRVLWDDVYKPLATDRSESLLDVALDSPPLRGALYTVLLGALLGVVFLGRRRQRPIPVRAPPPNAQREFARTVGRLFFVRDDRRWLARRKVRVFEDALRTRLGIADADLSDETATRASARTGVPEADALDLFARLRAADASPDPDADALLALDRDVNAFLSAREPAAEARTLS